MVTPEGWPKTKTGGRFQQVYQLWEGAVRRIPGPGGLRAAAIWCIVAGTSLLTSCSTILPALLTDRPATRTAEVILLEQKLDQTRQVRQQQTEVAATQRARQVTATAEEAARRTAAAQARQTAEAQATAVAAVTATSAAQQTATQQAAGMYTAVQEYVALGYLPSSAGRYVRLEDYEQNLATRSGLVARRTGYSLRVFAVRANVKYEVASKNANWFITGCGFLYWDNGQENYYSVMAALDGYAYARLFLRSNQYNLGRIFYGVPVRPSGEYTTTLIVNQDQSYFFVNNELLKKTDTIDTSMTDGALSYMLASGTDEDFGTRCSFSNVELWIVEE